MLSTHDKLLLKDLKLQPLWLCIAYIVIGLAAAAMGLFAATAMDRWLCLGGGFLIALGAEKLVTRRIRSAALQSLRSAGPLRARTTRHDWKPGHSAQRHG